MQNKQIQRDETQEIFYTGKNSGLLPPWRGKMSVGQKRGETNENTHCLHGKKDVPPSPLSAFGPPSPSRSEDDHSRLYRPLCHPGYKG